MNINEDNLWSGSELELLVILLEQEGFSWDNIVEHVAEDSDAGKQCGQCRDMLYSNEYKYDRERRLVFARSELAVRPTGFPTNDPSEAHKNNLAYRVRNHIIITVDRMRPF